MTALHAILVVVAFSLNFTAAQAVADKAQTIAAAGRAKVTLVQAIETALKEVPNGRAYEAELENEDGKLVYEVAIVVRDRCKEVTVDAMTGKVLEVEDEVSVLEQWSFDKAALDKTPNGFMIRQNNPTKAMAQWVVATDPAAPSQSNVLNVKTENDNATYNLAIVENISAKDVDLSVRVRGNSGKEDQGGGLIWRCKDENNYYICRINPLEPNYRVYKVEDGKRKQLQSVEVKTETGKWYTVRAVMIGGHIQCYLDGKKMLDIQDDTFKDAGKIGLWTKADACSSFDDLVLAR